MKERKHNEMKMKSVEGEGRRRSKAKETKWPRKEVCGVDTVERRLTLV